MSQSLLEKIENVLIKCERMTVCFPKSQDKEIINEFRRKLIRARLEMNQLKNRKNLIDGENKDQRNLEQTIIQENQKEEMYLLNQKMIYLYTRITNLNAEMSRYNMKMK